jgi:Domain of unknown function (DUF4124)
MKLFKTVFITFGLLFCFAIDGSTDSIYTWVDSKGVTHITQAPPPQAVKSIGVMNYSEQPEPPAPQPPTSGDRNQHQGNPNQGGGQAASGSSTGITSGDVGDNVEVDSSDDPYRRTLRQYERRGDLLDNTEPIREGIDRR